MVSFPSNDSGMACPIVILFFTYVLQIFGLSSQSCLLPSTCASLLGISADFLWIRWCERQKRGDHSGGGDGQIGNGGCRLQKCGQCARRCSCQSFWNASTTPRQKIWICLELVHTALQDPDLLINIQLSIIHWQNSWSMQGRERCNQMVCIDPRSKEFGIWHCYSDVCWVKLELTLCFWKQ